MAEPEKKNGGTLLRALAKFFRLRPSPEDLQARNVLQGHPSDASAGEKKRKSREKAATYLDLRLSRRADRNDLIARGIIKDGLRFNMTLMDLSQSDSGIEGGVPDFLWSCAQAILAELTAEGLFRVNGSAPAIKKLREAAENGDDLPKADEIDVHAITGFVGSFLRALPDPVLTFDLYQDLLKLGHDLDDGGGFQSSEACAKAVQTMKGLLTRLPEPHFVFLRWFVELLKMVTLCSDSNRMAPENVGTVFGPTLMKAKEDNLETFSSLRYNAIVVELVVRYYFELFPLDHSDPPLLLSTTRDIPSCLHKQFAERIAMRKKIDAVVAAAVAAADAQSAQMKTPTVVKSGAISPRARPGKPLPQQPSVRAQQGQEPQDHARKHSKSYLPPPTIPKEPPPTRSPSYRAAVTSSTTLPRDFNLSQHQKAVLDMRSKPLPAPPKTAPQQLPASCGDLFSGQKEPESERPIHRDYSAGTIRPTKQRPPIPVRTDLVESGAASASTSTTSSSAMRPLPVGKPSSPGSAPSRPLPKPSSSPSSGFLRSPTSVRAQPGALAVSEPTAVPASSKSPGLSSSMPHSTRFSPPAGSSPVGIARASLATGAAGQISKSYSSTSFVPPKSIGSPQALTKASSASSTPEGSPANRKPVQLTPRVSAPPAASTSPKPTGPRGPSGPHSFVR